MCIYRETLSLHVLALCDGEKAFFQTITGAIEKLRKKLNNFDGDNYCYCKLIIEKLHFLTNLNIEISSIYTNKILNLIIIIHKQRKVELVHNNRERKVSSLVWA